MFDISNFRYRNKRRIHEIDETLDNLTHAVKNLNNVVLKSEFECSIMAAKLKREKVRALTAVANSQVILAEMEVAIAENELISDLERLKNAKKTKFDRNGDTFHHSTPLTSVHNSPHAPLSPTTTKTKSSEVQSIQTKKKHSSLKKSKTDLDDTILVSTAEKAKSDSIKENSQPITPLNQSVKRNSDSQISITSSINAEFNNSYSKSTVDNKSKHSHSKTRSSDTKSSSKSKSCKKTESQSITDKTEAEANKNLFHKKLISTPTVKNRLKPKTETKTAVTTCTYVPVRHNLPLIITQSNIQNTYCPKSTAPIMSPGPYTSTSMTPANINQTPNRSQNLFYFGSKE